MEVYKMNKKDVNWVYLFDKHNITEEESREYITKNPDLTSSDLTQEESEYYASVEYLTESAMLEEYLKLEREEQARLLGCTPEEYDNFEELLFGPSDQDELEYYPEETTRDVIKKFGAPKLAPREEIVLSDQELQELEEQKQRKQATEEAYEKEKSLLEENQTAEYIRSCHQDPTDDKSNNS